MMDRGGHHMMDGVHYIMDRVHHMMNRIYYVMVFEVGKEINLVSSNMFDIFYSQSFHEDSQVCVCHFVSFKFE